MTNLVGPHVKSFLIALFLSPLLVACTIAKMQEDTPRYDGVLYGNNSQLVRCAVSQFESHERFLIRTMVFEVRTYPDIETVELIATQNTTTLIAEHFRMSVRQTSPDSVYVEITGWAEDTSTLAWKIIGDCQGKIRIE